MIFMDLHMPEMDGKQAASMIRKAGASQNAWIVALTADAFEQTRQECRAVGMNHFATKPVSKDAVAEAFRLYMAEKHPRAAA